MEVRWPLTPEAQRSSLGPPQKGLGTSWGKKGGGRGKSPPERTPRASLPSALREEGGLFSLREEGVEAQDLRL